MEFHFVIILNLQKILAVDDEKNVEAFIHLKKILGIMWHPEREKRFKKQDLDLFRSFCD